ncbi:hypothetical protein MPS_0575 [Mycobacterium pseudoshottsii JCM 15466]|nr:hypothetical protein MPS_0575 [Mycobacterium pseudoshottsii JCM 15466]
MMIGHTSNCVGLIGNKIWQSLLKLGLSLAHGPGRTADPAPQWGTHLWISHRPGYSTGVGAAART